MQPCPQAFLFSSSLGMKFFLPCDVSHMILLFLVVFQNMGTR